MNDMKTINLNNIYLTINFILKKSNFNHSVDSLVRIVFSSISVPIVNFASFSLQLLPITHLDKTKLF